MSQTSTISQECQMTTLPSSAIAESQAKNKKTTLQDRSHACEKNSKTQKSSKTSEADSTLKEKGCKPFYNDYCKDISSHLLSHTEIDCADSVLNSSTTFLNKMVGKSWFSTIQKHHRNGNSQKTCLQYFMSSLAECTDCVGMKTKSRKIRIYPTKQQKHLFRQWFGVSRKIYNAAVSRYNEKDRKRISWMDMAKDIFSEMDYDYVKVVPYQIKKIAVKDCYQALVNGCRKTKKTGETFKLSFRTRKNPKQSCYIPKQALKKEGIYHTIAGKLKISERSLLNYEHRDLRLVAEYDRWYVVVPLEFGNMSLMCSENQGNGDVVAIDPGIRHFLTYFSENGYFGHICGEYSVLLKLQLKIDRLISRMSKEKDKFKKRNLKRTVGKTRLRLRDLVDELHWKAIGFLVRNFSVIILPSFETSGMVKKGKRKLRKSVVRSMQSFRFYEFSQRLEMKCKEYGVLLIRSNESYTSRTNSFNGELMNIGSRELFVYDGVTVNRDVNGARNILLRAMRDSSAKN